MKDPRIPLYLITGFLDSGKTTLLTDTLNMDYFADGQRTVLLMCEDGETEYDPEQLSRLNTRLVPVQDQAQLNTSFLQEIDRRYQPERVLLEYNGMWPIQILRDLKLPKTWGLYQAIDVIDGSTFEMYRSNMQSMVIDMVTEADMVLFNRCTPDMPLSGWKRSIRAVNRMCEIVFDDENGVMNKSILDINGEILVISQFTLHASTKKGNRPSYIRAAKPDISVPLYEQFCKDLSFL